MMVVLLSAYSLPLDIIIIHLISHDGLGENDKDFFSPDSRE